MAKAIEHLDAGELRIKDNFQKFQVLFRELAKIRRTFIFRLKLYKLAIENTMNETDGDKPNLVLSSVDFAAFQGIYEIFLPFC